MRRIRHIWSSLREQLATDVPLNSITIRADGERVVASDGSTAWQPDSGQYLLDFEASEIVERARTAARNTAAGADAPHGRRTGVAKASSDPETLVAHLEPLVTRPAPHAAGPAAQSTRTEPGALRSRMRSLEAATSSPPGAASDEEPEHTAEEWYEMALELESNSPAEAIEAYRHTLERDPAMADAHVNLGRLYHLTGERGRAEAQYRDAVRLAPDDPVPHFNLGVLMEEQGRREEAAHAYLQAVSRDPDFADAHCNLGLLLESLGRRQEAARHLMAARDLYRST
jgi:tetratricopeptide (TPR) repeat protein